MLENEERDAYEIRLDILIEDARSAKEQVSRNLDMARQHFDTLRQARDEYRKIRIRESAKK